MAIIIFLLVSAGIIGTAESAKSQTRADAIQQTTNRLCKVKNPAPTCPEKELKRAARNREYMRTHKVVNLALGATMLIEKTPTEIKADQAAK